MIPGDIALKDSGVEWLGRVPEHWRVARLKWSIAGCINGVWGGEPEGEDDLLCVRVADFDRASSRVSLKKPTYRSVSKSERVGRMLNVGDLLLEKSGGGIKQLVGCVVLYDHEVPAVCSNFVGRVVPAENADPAYSTYVHQALYAGKLNYPAIKQTTGIQNLDAAAYFDTPAAFPPLDEQVSISEYLDRETARIDRLITLQESLIERLDEYRTALVTWVVTKGLPPEAAEAAGLEPEPALKDSGVEWLGEVPEHWDVVVLKRIASINDEALSDDEDPTRLMEYVDIGSVRYGEGVVERTSLMFEDAPSRARRLVQDGDTIISTVRTYLRAIAQLTDPPPSMVVSTGFAVVRPRSIESRFAYWAMSEAGFVSEIVARSVGVSYPAINALQIGLLAIAVPPSEEQQAIVEHLDEATGRIDALRAKAEMSIERLSEYRSALISAAVTGKIDVREAALAGGGV